MSVMETARLTARNRMARVVLPEMDEPRISEAAARLRARGLADPVPLAPPSGALLEALLDIRPMKPALAERLLEKPLMRAAAMLSAGLADVMVAGAVAPTRRVIEAAGMAVGLEPGIKAPSSFFLMLFPDGRELLFADCALNVAPDADTLKGIAEASMRSGQALFGTARPALLSFSTGSSGSGASVDLVRETAKATGLPGPLQADAALNAAIASAKGAREGAFGGDANVLIFPSLDAGNIAYKLCQELAGAQAVGPILQGFRRPVCDLSRGATVEDIVDATTLTIALEAG